MIVEFDANELLDQLAGSPHGTEFPRRFNDVDARHVALETLKTYLTLLIFARRGDRNGEPLAYRIPRANIKTEMPGEPDNLAFPSVGVIAGEGTHDTFGLGPPQVLEDSADVYGKDKVLVSLAEYTEELNLELWADSLPQRRSLVAGMLEALMPLQETNTLRLKLPDYYDRVATFEFTGERYIDDPDVVRGRYRCHLRVTLTVPEVALVGYVRLIPMVELEVADSQVEALLEVAEIAATRTAPQGG